MTWSVGSAFPGERHPTPRVLRYERPWLYPKQEAAIFCVERIGIVEASTKSGKSAGSRAWLLEEALKGKRGQEYWWTDPTYAMAYDIGFKEMKHALPQSMIETNEGRLQITLRPNGAILSFKGTENPDGLYGRDVYAAVMDEATRSKEAAWIAVQTTLGATNGPLRIISNVRGRKNWAYQLARRAEKGEPDMHYAKLVAADAIAAGILSSEAVGMAQRTMPERFFRELYLAEAATDTGNPFQGIEACIYPLSVNPVVVWGVDFGQLVDWTVLVGLDATGVVAGFHRFQAPWTETLRRVQGICGDIPTLVDATHGSVGDPVVQFLQHEGAAGNFEAFNFTSQSKQAIMETLGIAIEGQRVKYPEGPIAIELRSFEYEYTAHGIKYRAPEGSHDDCVCALALAWTKYIQRPAPITIGFLDSPGAMAEQRRVTVRG